MFHQTIYFKRGMGGEKICAKKGHFSYFTFGYKYKFEQKLTKTFIDMAQ